MPVAAVNAVDHGRGRTFPTRPDDPLAMLRHQDLVRLSVAELDARIHALEAELARTREHAERAVNHRARADAVFRK